MIMIRIIIIVIKAIIRIIIIMIIIMIIIIILIMIIIIITMLIAMIISIFDNVDPIFILDDEVKESRAESVYVQICVLTTTVFFILTDLFHFFHFLLFLVRGHLES